PRSLVSNTFLPNYQAMRTGSPRENAQRHLWHAAQVDEYWAFSYHDAVRQYKLWKIMEKRKASNLCSAVPRRYFSTEHSHGVEAVTIPERGLKLFLLPLHCYL